MAYRTHPSGGTAGALLWEETDDGTDYLALLENTRNSAGADATIEARVGGTSAGDPVFLWSIPSGTSWAAIADNDASDEWALLSGGVAGTKRIRISTAGDFAFGSAAPTSATKFLVKQGTTGGLAVEAANASEPANNGVQSTDSRSLQLVQYANGVGGTAAGVSRNALAIIQAANTVGLLIRHVDNGSIYVATNETVRASWEGSGGDFFMGQGGLATTATAGYTHMTSCAGVPTGVPATVKANMVTLQYDRTNDDLYVYNGGWMMV